MTTKKSRTPPASTAKKVAAAPKRKPAPAKADAKSTAKLALKTKLPADPKAKAKLVRDSFTIPKTEYAVLEALKDRGLSLARPVKKSELLRAGIGALNGMHDKAFLEAINAVPSLKTGRPKHNKATDEVAPKDKG